MANAVIVCCILIGFTGDASAEKSLSDSSIAALACLFGLIFIVLVLSSFCYCYGKKKQQEKRQKRTGELLEINNGFGENYSEYIHPDDNMVTADTSRKYTDWRMSKSATDRYSTPVVLTTHPQSRESRYVIRSDRPTTRSISPSRSSPRSPGFERGRSRQRFVYPNQHGYNTIVVNKRSKSAPAMNRMVSHDRMSHMQNRHLYYTKSHYLAIKQPFSKKYLLPPVRTYYSERPAERRVLVPPQQQFVHVNQPGQQQYVHVNQRQQQYVHVNQQHQQQFVHVNQPGQQQYVHVNQQRQQHVNQPGQQVVQLNQHHPPPPPKQESASSNVYHIQFQPSSSNMVVNRLPNDVDERMFRNAVSTNTRTITEPTQIHQSSYQNVRSYEEPVQTSYRSYEEPLQMSYKTYEEEPIQTSLTSYRPRVIQEPYVYRTTENEGADNRASMCKILKISPLNELVFLKYIWSGEHLYVNNNAANFGESESAFTRTSGYRISYNEAKVTNGTGQTTTVADDFTIIDFVETGGSDTKANTGLVNIDVAGTSAENGATVHTKIVTSSTSGVPDSSALKDLENLLDGHTSSSSSSSSSSSNSSKKSK